MAAALDGPELNNLVNDWRFKLLIKDTVFVEPFLPLPLHLPLFDKTMALACCPVGSWMEPLGPRNCAMVMLRNRRLQAE
uniref:Uncharacterized protein n=1 Tax=Romanomermis culicivorax TaxID=13658 RepID=A0A915KEM8_ROMCU